MHKKLLSGFAVVLICHAAQAQYCSSGGPTSTADSNVQLVKLASTTDSISHIGCPGVLGVQNLTAQSVTVTAGNPYTLKVQFGTCGGNYTGGGEIWIDYDQNGVFDQTESVGTWTGIPPVALSVYTVNIPVNAVNGPTRMRVMQQEGTTAIPPLNPCGAFQWGSVMDFTVVVTGGINCTGYTGDDTSDPIIVTSFPYTDTRDASYCYSNDNFVYASPDVYYRVTPTTQVASIHASLCGSTFDTFLSVVDENGTVITYNDDSNGCSPYSELTFSAAGVDTAYIIVEGWGLATGMYTLNLTAGYVDVEEHQLPAFAVFPNPANDQFVVKGFIGGQLQLLDMTGRVVETIANYKGESISTAAFAPGIYSIRFEYEGQPVTKKISISK